jgi:signal transduction histidine kinase
MDSASIASSSRPSIPADPSLDAEHRVVRRRPTSQRRLAGTRDQRPALSQADYSLDHDRVIGPRAQRGGSLAWRTVTVLITALAAADLFVDQPALRWGTWVLAVLVAGVAALLSAMAAEATPAALLHERFGDQTAAEHARRWHMQAVASAAVMLMLMAGGPGGSGSDVLWWLVVLGAAGTLVAMATTYRDGERPGLGSVYLTLDAVTVGVTVGLITVSLANGSGSPSGSSAGLLLGAFAAAGYAVAVATRPAIREEPRGSDALFLGGVLVLCLHAAGEAAQQIGLAPFSTLETPGVALFGSLGLARSAWARSRPFETPHEAGTESRLRLVPATTAAAAIVLLSWAELTGHGSRTGFFGVLLLFGFIIGRLMLTLLDNRQLLQRVERSGVFEEKLRDLGAALLAALDRKEALELVCRTAQMALGADSVMLWMVDPTTAELEAVEVVSPKRRSLLRRRLSLEDPTSVAARVVRSGLSEIVLHVPTANQTNGFLSVLLRAQALLAVPIMRETTVQGVLVCIDSRNPTAYSAREQAKAELLASQVAVALDNAYQHSLQRRRLEELTALYQFAQSAHAALSGSEIIRQLLPIIKERLKYTHASIWLRDETSGTLRLVVSDAPAGGPQTAARPSALGMRAFVSGQPARAGLGWGDPESEMVPDRSGIRSELAVPMVLKRRVVGVVDLESRQVNAYSVHEERLLVALANHAALAVDNLHLLAEARKVEALKELDRMKTELLSTVSHELRTPLGSIKGYATTLLTHEARLRREERREFLEIIDSEADRLRELIENLLEMSRLEAGMLRIDKEPARLGGLAREVTRKVQLATTAHEVVLDWPSDDPWVLADTKRVYQVMQNLMSNAVKYSPQGGRITLAGGFGPRELTISVADQGLGMPAAELDKIFDRFHRVGGEVSRRIGGTGLGLAISQGLVEAHGGRIWADSDGEGHGSTFHFTLPLLPEAGEVSTAESRSKGRHDYQEANRTRR